MSVFSEIRLRYTENVLVQILRILPYYGNDRYVWELQMTVHVANLKWPVHLIAWKDFQHLIIPRTMRILYLGAITCVELAFISGYLCDYWVELVVLSLQRVSFIQFVYLSLRDVDITEISWAGGSSWQFREMIHTDLNRHIFFARWFMEFGFIYLWN